MVSDASSDTPKTMSLEIKKAEFVTSVYDLDSLPKRKLPEMAVAGRSNVGKSSLLNRLVGRKSLAKVSSTPGKTRCLNYFLINEGFYLVDLPGYGYAKAPKSLKKAWAELVSNYLEDSEYLAGLVHIIDSRHPPTPLDRQLTEYLQDLGMRVLVALTKVDKLTNRSRAELTRELEKDELYGPLDKIFFSIVTGEGKREILRWMEAQLTYAKTLSKR